jgi:hypothetical protein
MISNIVEVTPMYKKMMNHVERMSEDRWQKAARNYNYRAKIKRKAKEMMERGL